MDTMVDSTKTGVFNTANQMKTPLKPIHGSCKCRRIGNKKFDSNLFSEYCSFMQRVRKCCKACYNFNSVCFQYYRTNFSSVQELIAVKLSSKVVGKGVKSPERNVQVYNILPQQGSFFHVPQTFCTYVLQYFQFYILKPMFMFLILTMYHCRTTLLR